MIDSWKCLYVPYMYVNSDTINTFKKHESDWIHSVLFAERVINVWNSLPSDLADFSTMKIGSLKTVDLSGYCIGSI